jgi:RimJ/RimL family protein N-acetyltransferase
MNLETERLILRNLRESDLDDFHIYRSNPEICKFQGFDVFTIEDSRAFIESQKNAKFGVPGEWMQVGFEYKVNKRLIGDLALKPEAVEPRTIEIGVTLNLEYRKKEFAVEAFTRIFEYLFSETETHRVFGLLDVENAGSLRLLENLNFRREGEFKKSYWDKKMNEWRDEYLYALLKEDWKTD